MYPPTVTVTLIWSSLFPRRPSYTDNPSFCDLRVMHELSGSGRRGVPSYSHETAEIFRLPVDHYLIKEIAPARLPTANRLASMYGTEPSCAMKAG